MTKYDILPSRKQNKKSIRKVLKAVENKHPRLPIDYTVKRKGGKTGLVGK